MSAGTPGRSRFWFLWDELARGSVGAGVPVDLRRVAECLPAIDFFESRRLPCVTAVDRFPGAEEFDADTLREGLALRPGRPVVWMDAREPGRSRQTRVALGEHAPTRSAVAPA